MTFIPHKGMDLAKICISKMVYCLPQSKAASAVFYCDLHDVPITSRFVSAPIQSSKYNSFVVIFYPDNRGFSWHAKCGEKRKTSEDIVSQSC